MYGSDQVSVVSLRGAALCRVRCTVEQWQLAGFMARRSPVRARPVPPSGEAE